MALWHYPLAPPWVPMPQVDLPHPFYAPVVSEQPGQVGIDTRFVDPELGYGFQNLPATRGYQADDDAEKTKKGVFGITMVMLLGLGALAAMYFKFRDR